VNAIVQTGYGSPAVLQLRDVPVPVVGDDGVLVRVQAAALNALDWHTTRGMPYLIRVMDGLSAPRKNIRGIDVAGRVEAVGRNVVDFQPGDEVFGGTDGSLAEYTVTSPERLAHKPAGFAAHEAAALYVAGLTALQGVRDRGRLRAGQSILINGAGGGVGTFAVQIAKWIGAHVTAVTRTEHMEMVASIGADAVLDYRREDFSRRRERYDVIFDIGGNRSLGACRRVLSENGTLVVVGAPAGRWLAPATRMLKVAVVAPFVHHRLVPFISSNDRAGLALLKQLAEDRKLVVVVDRSYPLHAAPAALAYLGTGAAKGKVVVRVE
jgi:NADPH:quinone reductase-like Zn-dependent oxidoreductase